MLGDDLEPWVLGALVQHSAVFIVRSARTVPTSVVFTLVHEWVEVVRRSDIGIRLLELLD